MGLLEGKSSEYDDEIADEVYKQWPLRELVHAHKITIPSLKRYSKRYKGRQMVGSKANSTVKDLAEPDMFPISDLKANISEYISHWESVMQKIKGDLGFRLTARESQIEHEDAGDGVFLEKD